MIQLHPDLLLLSDVRSLNNRKHVQDCFDQVRRVLLEYCVNCYPNIPVSPYFCPEMMLKHSYIGLSILAVILTYAYGTYGSAK